MGFLQRLESMAGVILFLTSSIAAEPRRAAAQSSVSAPVEVSLRVIVPERIPHDAGPRAEVVSRTGASLVELTTTVGLAPGRVSRLDVRLAKEAAAVPGSSRIRVRSSDGHLVPLVAARWVTVADTRHSTRVGEWAVVFYVESDGAVPRPVVVPIVYRLVVGEGESARDRSYFSLLGAASAW